MRESYIQKKCQEYAKKQMSGVVILRTVTEGMPDRQFLWNEICFFVEFKATGKKARPLQLQKMKDLHNQGFPSFVIDNLNDFKEVVQAQKDWANHKTCAYTHGFLDRCCPYVNMAEEKADF